jgi:muramoyltetrapeptide carboxypeptidase
MLPRGSKVAVVAPAGIPDRDCLQLGLQILADWGYVPISGRHLYDQHKYTAGQAGDRAVDLQWALQADDVDAVWIARGGFGCAHCFPYLDWAAVRERLVIGFSDATALLYALTAHTAATPIHGPNLDRLAKISDQSREAMRALLQEPAPSRWKIECCSAAAEEITGRMIGGNLAVLSSMVGTPWQVAMGGCLLMLEDVGEPGYRLDRLFTQLLQSGSLKDVRALLLGEFLRCPLPKGVDIGEFFAELLNGLNIPVLTGLPIGHGDMNMPWYYGAYGRLSGDFLEVTSGLDKIPHATTPR